MEIIRVAEVDGTRYFGEEEESSPNKSFCVRYAAFQHTSACEFMLFVGGDDPNNSDSFLSTLKKMEESGCTQDFIDVYKEAREQKAIWLLLYV
jgi:hypothetical protein